MKLLTILFREAETPKLKFLALAICAGLSGVLILAVLNVSAEHASDGTPRFLSVVYFSLAMAINILSQKYVWANSIRDVEVIVTNMRTRIFQKIAGCNLQGIEKIGKADLYTAINQHTYTISTASTSLMASVQNLIIVVFSLGYLAWLSLLAFSLTILFIGIVTVISLGRSKVTNKNLDAAVNSEQKVFYSLNDLLEGFQEVKLNQDRHKGLISDALHLAHTARDNRVEANQALTLNFVGTQISFYFLLGILVFMVPQFSLSAYSDTVVKIATVGLFLMGPITGIVSLLPHIVNADHSFQFISKTEGQLDALQEDAQGAVDAFGAFKELSLSQIRHSYFDEQGHPSFKIGPIDLSVKPNEILFITGGNGSGKSTMIRILTGLYFPRNGTMTFNRHTIDKDNIISYRSLFATVLSDYHLFPQSHGLAHVDPQEVYELLETMGLKGKTSFKDGYFDSFALSTGQKKRLALIVAILEDRPIMVFDEWAADQDPQFRRIFYKKILPDLKAKGKTIIAVTHDEKYFDCSDRHCHMDEGILTDVTTRKDNKA